MPVYRQKYIPSIKIQKKGYKLKEYVRKYYSEHIQGITIVNKDIGLTIYFGADGKAELANGRAMYEKKAALVQCLPELLTHAEYTNFGTRKFTDPKNIFGYANFKAKVYIDGKLEHAHITVLVKANGKAYYCHEINIIKEPLGAGV